MAEETSNAKAQIITYACDKPKCKGALTFTGETVGITVITGYKHKCDKCGVAMTLPKKYPDTIITSGGGLLGLDL